MASARATANKKTTATASKKAAPTKPATASTPAKTAAPTPAKPAAASATAKPATTTPTAAASKATPVRKFTTVYSSAPWNKSSKTVDSAFLFLRDKNSGKFAKIILEETEPDSSTFSGQFSVNWDTTKPIAPEVYIPPQSLRDDPRAVERFTTMLNNGTIKAQPLAIRQEKGQQVLEVFDTAEMAARAGEAYKKAQIAAEKAEQSNLVKPQAQENSLQVAKMTEHAVELAKLAKEAADREAARLRIEQLEAQRAAALKAEQDKLSAAEKAQRRKQAADLSARAIESYKKGDYPTAEKLFREAISLEPDNKNNNFMYGVTLYRVEKFDEALVTLKNAETKGQSQIEKNYYLALIHYRLKEYDAARDDFEKVKKSGDPVLAPSAAFYEGLIYFSNEDLEKAQASFESVLDTSNDPALDKLADDYIEKIAQAIQYKKMAAQKIFVNASFGASYDSNILYQPDNPSSAATTVYDKGGVRWSATGDLSYRFFFKESSDFAVKAAVMDMQSLSTDFVQADPLMYTLSAPFALKGVWNTKGYKLTLTPSYERLNMDVNRAGEMTNILNSQVFTTDLMLVMNDRWFSSTNLELRQDDSLLEGVTDDSPENADATKITVKKSEVCFLDEAKKQALMPSLSYSLNNAKGDNKIYNKIELSTIYAAPWERYKNMTWMTGLTFSIQDFNKAANSRKDTATSLLLGISKILDPSWTWGTNLTYSTNGSTLADYDYSKYILMSTISYTWAH